MNRVVLLDGRALDRSDLENEIGITACPVAGSDHFRSQFIMCT